MKLYVKTLIYFEINVAFIIIRCFFLALYINIHLSYCTSSKLQGQDAVLCCTMSPGYLFLVTKTGLATSSHYFNLYLLKYSTTTNISQYFIIYHPFCPQKSSKRPSLFLFVCGLSLMYTFQNFFAFNKSNIPFLPISHYQKPVLEFAFNHNTINNT